LSELEHAVLSDAFDPMTTARQFTLAMSDGGQIARQPRLTRILAKEMPHSRLRVVGIDTYMSLGGITGTSLIEFLGQRLGLRKVMAPAPTVTTEIKLVKCSNWTVESVYQNLPRRVGRRTFSAANGGVGGRRA
jgi:hypothetical protein